MSSPDISIRQLPVWKTPVCSLNVNGHKSISWDLHMCFYSVILCQRGFRWDEGPDTLRTLLLWWSTIRWWLCWLLCFLAYNTPNRSILLCLVERTVLRDVQASIPWWAECYLGPHTGGELKFGPASPYFPPHQGLWFEERVHWCLENNVIVCQPFQDLRPFVKSSVEAMECKTHCGVRQTFLA